MRDLNRILQEAQPSQAELCQAAVETYYSFIYRLAYSILNDPDAADDAAQETFIRAFTRPGQYPSPEKLKSWLATIAVNYCRDQLRRQKARFNIKTILGSLAHFSAASSDPSVEVEFNEQSELLRRAVEILDEKHRIPLILRFVHELPVHEISAILNVNEGTIHSRLHYAIQKLRTHLGGSLHEFPARDLAMRLKSGGQE